MERKAIQERMERWRKWLLTLEKEPIIYKSPVKTPRRGLEEINGPKMMKHMKVLGDNARVVIKIIPLFCF